MSSVSEKAVVYAALILHDDGVEITADKLTTLIKAANVDVEPIWASLFAKALQGKNLDDLLSNVGSGPAVAVSGSAGGAAPAAGGAGAAAAPAAAKEEEKEESDEDMGFATRRPRVAEAAKGCCVKCKTAKAQLYIRQADYCKACFIVATELKFRQAAGRLQINSRQPGRAALALSGGWGSRIMMHLLLARTDDARRSGGVFDGIDVIHIDESAVFPETPASYKADLAAMVRSYGHRLVTVPLEAVLAARGEEYTYGTAEPSTDSDAVSKLRELMATSAGTAREDLLVHLRLRLLLTISQSLGCSHLLLGSSTTRLAAEIIATTAKGRGYGLALDIATSADYYPSVRIHRPMATFVLKELAIYGHYQRLTRIPFPSFSTKQRPQQKSSINQLAAMLINSLEAEHAGTASTVYRTAVKVDTGLLSAPDERARACALCLGPVTVVGGDGEPLCPACTTVVAELSRGERKGSTRSVTVPIRSSSSSRDESLRQAIQEYLLPSDDE
ncbi:Cytoplasmic tRNA 2-thiolation protein 2 [Sorochytrium milnesiophthora]